MYKNSILILQAEMLFEYNLRGKQGLNLKEKEANILHSIAFHRDRNASWPWFFSDYVLFSSAVMCFTRHNIDLMQ